MTDVLNNKLMFAVKISYPKPMGKQYGSLCFSSLLVYLITDLICCTLEGSWYQASYEKVSASAVQK